MGGPSSQRGGTQSYRPIRRRRATLGSRGFGQTAMHSRTDAVDNSSSMAATIRRTSDLKRPAARRACKLTVHNHEFMNGAELVINPEYFPSIQMNDVLEICQPDHPHDQLFLQVSSTEPIRGKLQVSVLAEIAAQFQLEPFRDVEVKRIDSSADPVEFIELTFKDQFVSRADIWRFELEVYGRSVYVGKNLQLLGIRAQVKELLKEGHPISSGVISESTKFIFRSRSARIFWLVQMSSEMWEFDDSGELFFEKFVNRFVKGVSLLLSVIVDAEYPIDAFSTLERVFYDWDQFPSGFDPRDPHYLRSTYSSKDWEFGHGPAIKVDNDGRLYEDFYQVVVDNHKGPDYHSIVTLLKASFNQYAVLHRWRDDRQKSKATLRSQPNLSEGDVMSWEMLPQGVPTGAVEGNLLEAINVCLNILDKHYMDRDLSRAGQSIVMISAGAGVFKVDQRLAAVTKQRMMDNGIGMDMLCLARPPLHVVPLFIFNRPSDDTKGFFETFDEGTRPESRMRFLNTRQQSSYPTFETRSRPPAKLPDDGFIPENSSFHIPHWINISFLDLADEISGPGQQSVIFAPHLEHLKNSTAQDCTFRRLSPPLLAAMGGRDAADRLNSEIMLDKAKRAATAPTLLQRVLSTRLLGKHMIHLQPLPEPDFATVVIRQWCEKLESLDAGCSQVQRLDELFAEFDQVMFTPKMFDGHRDKLTIHGIPISRWSRRSTNSGGASISRNETALSSSPSQNSGDGLAIINNHRDFGSPCSFSAGQDKQPDLQQSSATPRAHLRSSSSMLKKHRVLTGRRALLVSESRSPRVSASSLGDLRAENTKISSSAPSASWMKIRAKQRDAGSGSPGSLISSSPSSMSSRLQGPLPGMLSEKSSGTLDMRPLTGPNHNNAAIVVSHGPQVNPFQGAREYQSSLSSTTNRRRWSHLFPSDEAEFKLYTGPNWKSLTSPAILPLTTDDCPTAQELKNNYVQSFYSLTLPERGSRDYDSNSRHYANHRQLLLELVCQRLAMDFQLVSDHSRGVKSLATSKDRYRYLLSMGHRVQELSYDPDTQAIDVKRYVRRDSTSDENEPLEYMYSMWMPLTKSFHTTHQQFFEFPNPEYNWNYLDQLLCGYFDSISEQSKAKRMRFCFLPMVRTQKLDGKKLKLKDWETSDRPGVDNYVSVESALPERVLDEQSVKFMRIFEFLSDVSQKFDKQSREDKDQVEILKNPQTKGLVWTCNKIVFVVPMGSPNKVKEDRQDWLEVHCDEVFDPRRCYHFELRWHACDSAAVEDFITLLSRKSGQTGLELRQVPEYGRTKSLEIHPFLMPVFIPVADSTVLRFIEQALVVKYSFLPDDEQYCDSRGLGYGLVVGIEPETRQNLLLRKLAPAEREKIRKMRTYRQYMHAKVAVFVRVTYQGLVWIISRLHQKDSAGDFEVHDLFAKICSSIEAAKLAKGLVDEVSESVAHSLRL